MRLLFRSGLRHPQAPDKLDALNMKLRCEVRRR
jgi:hypothetical protein